MADVKWIKLATDIFDDEKIKLIESMPDRDAILVIWLKLLIQAGKCNDDGRIYLDVTLRYTDEMLATIFSRPVNTVRLAIETFEKFKMIEVDDDGTINLPNWEKHQNTQGLEKIKEQNRIRQQKFRERKAIPNVSVTDSDNVSVTLRNGTDKNKNKNKSVATLPPNVIEFSSKFYSHLKSEYPEKKIKVDNEKIEKGADAVRLLIEKDGFDLDKEIRPALVWALKDDFWSAQVNSLAELRKKKKGSDNHKFYNLFQQFSACGKSNGDDREPLY